MFAKLTLSFLFLGVLPMFGIGMFFLDYYMHNVEQMTLNSLESSAYYVAMSMEKVLDNVDEIVSAIYTYSTDDEYGHVYDVLRDKKLSETERNIYIAQMMNTLLGQKSYLSAIRFNRPDGYYHYSYADGTKVIHNVRMHPNVLDNEAEENPIGLRVLGTVYEGDYCSNSEDYIFTVARNYMNSRTLATSRSDILGTVYADVKLDAVTEFVDRVEVGENGRLYIINRDNQQYIYSSDQNDYGTAPQWMEEYEDEMINSTGVIRKNGRYLIYAQVRNTDCCVLEYIEKEDILGAFFRTRTSMLLLLVFTIFMVIAVHTVFSNRISTPVRELKDAMEKLESGDLSVRVNIHSRDEMEYLGDGFNHMANDLSQYIDQVYKAQISRREAELTALKMQIQPHYLYNTLDVIRMKALQHEDHEAAMLLENLSKQLRYITGNQSHEVTLEEELENIKEYFTIIRTRYNDLYDLEIRAKESDLKLKILKLILQPVVENAVKHGLREREGSGKVSIHVMRRADRLEIQIMDNGKGMNAEKKQQLRLLLQSSEEDTYSREGHIGIKNVYDRIQYNYGSEFGFTIDGQEGFGTIVTYYLPVIEESGSKGSLDQ